MMTVRMLPFSGGPPMQPYSTKGEFIGPFSGSDGVSATRFCLTGTTSIRYLPRKENLLLRCAILRGNHRHLYGYPRTKNLIHADGGSRALVSRGVAVNSQACCRTSNYGRYKRLTSQVNTPSRIPLNRQPFIICTSHSHTCASETCLALLVNTNYHFLFNTRSSMNPVL